ncbi:dehydrogenase/reductase SDR family member 4-like isoform X2 [Liolophura sinensis]
MVSSRKQQNVDETVRQLKGEELEVEGIVCHVGKTEDRSKLISKTLEKFGGIDILVSNAAVNPTFGPMLECSEEVWDKIFDVNVKAAFLLTKEVFPHMEKRGGGSVIFNSSIGGYVPFSLLGPYSVSKTALIGLTKALVHQLAASNIRVNLIAPGIIQTKFSEQLHSNDMVSQIALQNIPLGRFGKPEECAGIVSFLASDDASYITGEGFIIAGGTTSRL